MERRDLDRRRNSLQRLQTAPVIAACAAGAVGLVAYLAKPLSVHFGDITGPLVVFGPTIYEIRQTATGADAPVFFSDWSSATGTSDNAVTDYLKAFPWDANKGDPTGTAVTDTVDWQGALPSGTHALTIAIDNAGGTEGARLTGSLPALEAGDTRAYRVYFKNILPNTNPTDNSSHPLQDGAGGSNVNWEFDVLSFNSGTWAPHLEMVTSTGSFIGHTIDGLNENTNAGARVPKDSVYRFEWKFTMSSAGDSVDVEMKMYNADGALRVDSDRWINRITSTPSSSVEWFDSPQGARWASHQDLQIGTNGWGGGTSDPPMVAWHWGAVAICEDWCGPYNASLGR